jgi:NitT/TauT family transport system substrate-binding protein
MSGPESSDRPRDAASPLLAGDGAWSSVVGDLPRAGRRQWLAHAAGATGAALLSGLAGCAEPVAALKVGTIVFPGYEFLFLARELGVLGPREVRLVELLSSSDNLRLMEEGRLDAMTATVDEVMATRAKGVDLRIVAVLDVSEGADAVMARAGLQRPEQLRGRRIAVEDSAMGMVMLDAVLRAASLRVEDVIKLPFTPDQSLIVFQSEKVDALVTFEPWVSQLEALGAVRVYDSTQVPDRIVDVLVVRQDVLADRPKDVQRLVAAHFKALAHYRSDPAQASRLMAPRLQMVPEQVASAFRGLRLPDSAANRELLKPGGRFAGTFHQLQKLMMERGLMGQSVSFEQLVDPRFLP